MEDDTWSFSGHGRTQPAEFWFGDMLRYNFCTAAGAGQLSTLTFSRRSQQHYSASVATDLCGTKLHYF